MGNLSGAQKQYLRGLAHHLKPVVLIGRNGVTDEVIEQIDEALNAHELIKIKFNEYRDLKRELSQQIADRSGSERVGMVGNVAMFYRENAEPEKRKIRIPAGGEARKA